MITELYVPRPALSAFLAAVRADFRQHNVGLIYGTIRLIERDDESVLAWAREPWVCTAMNLHVEHTPDRTAKAAEDFRRLIDRAIEFGGSYFLTYHRWATRSQVEACHPRMSSSCARSGGTTQPSFSRAIGIAITSGSLQTAFSDELGPCTRLCERPDVVVYPRDEADVRPLLDWGGGADATPLAVAHHRRPAGAWPAGSGGPP